MIEPILTGLGIIFLYTLVHDRLLNQMVEDAKKPPKESRQDI